MVGGRYDDEHHHDANRIHTTMALTKRGSAWLATLKRTAPVVPTAKVEQLLRDGGHTPHRAWLEFHDTYAGYVEEFAPGDFALWGIAHASNRVPPPVWADADTVTVSPPNRGFPEGIVCADAHPVHDYELLADGRFMGVGGPSATFEMKIERHGVMADLALRGTVRTTRNSRGLAKQEKQDLIAQMRPYLVPEASDGSMQIYVEPTRVLRVGPLIDYLLLYEIDPP